jgi:transposase
VDEVITIGLDLAKGVFHAVGRDGSGQKLFSRQLRRGQVEGFFARHAPCVVAMEACGSAHDWGRRLEALGCRVKLIAPIYVKPFVVRNKNDARDADGLSQAAQRPDMRTVALKSAEQQARASLHRVRDLMIRQRTQLMNQVRGIAAEFGLTARVGRTGLMDVIAQAGPPICQRRRAWRSTFRLVIWTSWTPRSLS